MQQAIK